MEVSNPSRLSIVCAVAWFALAGGRARVHGAQDVTDPPLFEPLLRVSTDVQPQEDSTILENLAAETAPPDDQSLQYATVPQAVIAPPVLIPVRPAAWTGLTLLTLVPMLTRYRRFYA